jgi:hypothetical protein
MKDAAPPPPPWKVPTTPKILIPLAILELTKLLSPFTITEANPLYPESGLTI